MPTCLMRMSTAIFSCVSGETPLLGRSCLNEGDFEVSRSSIPGGVQGSQLRIGGKQTILGRCLHDVGASVTALIVVIY